LRIRGRIVIEVIQPAKAIVFVVVIRDEGRVVSRHDVLPMRRVRGSASARRELPWLP
jgi:hypothetical protein